MSAPTAEAAVELGSGSDYLHAIATKQRNKIMAAIALDSDLDFAFNLQLEEAITASLGLQDQPSTSSASVSKFNLDEDVPKSTDFLSDELLKLEQELVDQSISGIEFKKMRDDLHRRIHDHQVALEISRIPEEDWEDWGDEFERPFGEGSSEGINNEIFRVYFKGLVEKDLPGGLVLAGIGVAICDSRDNLIFELRKPLVGIGESRLGAEMGALAEGLNASLELDLKRVTVYCDHYPIFKYVTGRWSPNQRKVVALAKQVSLLKKKFNYCQAALVPRTDIKFAFKLAREAIDSEASKCAKSTSTETCVICLEDVNLSQMFSVDEDEHRYCFSCMKQHVEVKLLHGLFPTCPHEGCKTKLNIDSCRKFLTPRLIEIMSERIKEASIPVKEKVYCPYPKCSALMTKTEVCLYTKGSLIRGLGFGARTCMKCNGLFCLYCKVPWHAKISCLEYERRNPQPQIEEEKLKDLAETNLWRQCVKCNHMIELTSGCYHMTCRCGYEFCYNCGHEWKDKKATCTCPLWDERNIIEEELDEDEDDEDYEDFVDSDFDSDEYEYEY